MRDVPVPRWAWALLMALVLAWRPALADDEDALNEAGTWARTGDPRAVPALEKLARNAEQADLRADANAYLALICLTEGKPEEAVALLPPVHARRSGPRYDAELNLRALAAARQALRDGRWATARELYRFVAPRKVLLDYIDWKLKRLEPAPSRIPGLLPIPVSASPTAEDHRLKADRAVLEKLPEFEPARRLGLAAALRAEGRTDEAMRIYAATAKNFPDHDRADDALRAAVELACQVGRLDDAVYWADAYHGRFGADPAIDLRLAGALLAAGRTDEAAARLPSDKTLPSGDARYQAAFLRAMVDWRTGHRARATEALLVLQRLQPDREPAFFWHGVLDAEEGRLSNAHARFEQALTRAPGDPAAALWLGATELALGRPEAARGTFSRLTATQPEGVWAYAAHQLSAEASAMEGSDTAAQEQRLLMSASAPEGPARVKALAATLPPDADGDGALTAFIARTARPQSRAQAWSLLMVRAVERGDTALAFARLRDALLQLGNDPRTPSLDRMIERAEADTAGLVAHTTPDSLLERYRTAEKAGEVAAALRWLRLYEARTAAEPGSAPENSVVHLDQLDYRHASPATQLWLADRTRASNAGYSLEVLSAVANSRVDPVARRRALTSQATQFAREGRAEEAAQLLALARAIEPGSAESVEDALEEARLHLRQHQPQEAIAVLAPVLRGTSPESPAYAEALYTAAVARREAGDTVAAQGRFQQVYTLYPDLVPFAPRAYLASAECLELLGRPDARRRTLEQLAGNPAWQSVPEAAIAAAALKEATP